MQYGQQTMARILLLLWFAVGLADDSISIDRLAWLSGCWTSDGAEEGSGEQWSKPGGGTMLGTSRFVRNGKTVAYEFTRISETEDGSLVFIAAPSGQAGNAFPLASIDSHEVVFADPEHDFPQRILYRLIAPERLLGRIEGEVDGQTRAVDFPMTRSNCRE